ncbi:MAG: hypothetical protein J5911_03030 [Clostridia bacterium]|nr:hypothetical protein [Clostridia bacterium]
MLDRIIGVFFYKTEKKRTITVLSEKREMSRDIGTIKKAEKTEKDAAFWYEREKKYKALFSAMNTGDL